MSNLIGFYLGQGGGVAAYSAAVTYPAGGLAIGSDTNYYRAVQSTIGHDPVTDIGTYWELFYVFTDTTLNIGSGGARDFVTLAAAWSFLAKTAIASTATLTVKFADGTYSFAAATYTNFDLSHPFGARIAIIGNTSTKANVIWNWTGNYPGAPMFLLVGSRLKQIDGFTANAMGTMAAGPGTPYLSMFLYARDRASVVIGPNATINNFYSGVAAHFTSTARVTSITVTGGGDGNLWAYGGSSIYADGVTSTGAGTFFAGSGALADNESYIFLTNATIQGNLNGIAMFNNSAVKIDSATIGGAAANANSNADILINSISGVANLEGTATSIGSTNKIKTAAVGTITSSAVAAGGYLSVGSDGSLKLINSGAGEYRFSVGSRFGSNSDGSFFLLNEAGSNGTLSLATLSASAGATIYNATAIPAGGTAGSGYKLSSTSNLGIFFGSGLPTLSAAKGSLYIRSDGSPWFNTDGSTAWLRIGSTAPASWTPTDNSGAGLSFSSVSANVVVSGNMAFAYFSLTYPATASGANASIAGLTVNVANADYAAVPAVAYVSTGVNAILRPVKNTATAVFINAATGVAVTNVQLTGATISVCLIYPAS